MFDSLIEAILTLDEAQRTETHSDFENILRFITNQQLTYGADEGVFIETRNVSSPQPRLFTGEKLQTQLAAKNILTLEAARVLHLSNSRSDFVDESIRRVDTWLRKQCFSDFCATGECKHSTVSFVRYLSAKGLIGKLARMIEELRRYRDGKGGWNGFPYFYTLLVLSETYTPEVENELKYALPMIKRRYLRSKVEEPYRSRREEVLIRIHNRMNLTPSIYVS